MCKHWLVAYTKPRHEKKAADILLSSGFEAFLPVSKVLKTWSDRKKWVEMPMFSGYLFVNIDEKERMSVLNSFGIVRFITFSHQPAKVPVNVIEAIKIVSRDISHEVADSSPVHYVLGEEVCVTNGPLKGMRGRLVDVRGKSRLALEIDCMQKTVLIEVNRAHLN